ncbi:MAG: hypothetical protein A2W28_04510 [Gammaproteobacteria bacterium RBG_16_51_14]|nr:MAG: hypothetical protein A2W28_04510 [Gammaproteobacteria bacterium RBG_16_51_14]
MKNKIFCAVLVAGVITAGVVIADYFSLFGITQQVKTGFVGAQFKTVDAENGMLVNDVHVRCFQKMNENACGQRDSHEPGKVYIKIPVRRVVSRSLFFNQGEVIIKTRDPKLHIMFIHPDYDNPINSFELIELYANPDRQFLVNMVPRDEAQVDRE